jgi:glycerate dehydrogenase
VGSKYDRERLAGMYSKLPARLPQSITNPQLGLIGLGNIGLQIANLAQALGFKRIIYHTRTPNLSCPEYTHVPLEDLYAESDAIVITCPLNNSTRGLINDKAFEGMKEDMILVNVARDDEALVRALDSGKGMRPLVCVE